ncbi:MAG: hypothetical protein AAFR16_01950 [Pseudomonadota bacterium]
MITTIKDSPLDRLRAMFDDAPVFTAYEADARLIRRYEDEDPVFQYVLHRPIQRPAGDAWLAPIAETRLQLYALTVDRAYTGQPVADVLRLFIEDDLRACGLSLDRTPTPRGGIDEWRFWHPSRATRIH